MKKKLALLLAALLLVPLGCARAERGPAEAELPSVEAIADGFCRVIAGIEPGTAGASLKTAQAVCGVLRVCGLYRPAEADRAALRERLRAAEERLDETERAAYAEHLPGMAETLLKLTDGTEAPGAEYEDAGVLEETVRLLDDPAVCEGAALLLELALEEARDTEP